MITMGSVAFTALLAVSMKSMQNGVFDNMISNLIRYYSGYLQVHKKGYWDEKVLDNCINPADSILLSGLNHPQVSELIPRIENFVLLSNGEKTKGAFLVGIDHQKEEPLTRFSQKIIKGSFWNPGDTGMVMAKGLAERLSLQIGDTVFIIGQGYHERFAAGAYPLRGIMQFGSPELNNSMAFLPLPLATDLFSMEGMVTGLVLDIRDPNAMPQIQEEIRKKLPEQYELMSWKQMMPDIDNHMKADGMGYYIMMGILYTIILFGTFGTIFMITNERKYEFSMLLAIGMKRRFLAMTLIGEMVLLMICGAIAGMFISIPLVLYFEKHPLRLGGEMAKAFESYGFEAVWPAQFSWSILIDQTLIVLVIGLLVGLYPVYHVMKFKEAGKIRL